MKASTLKLREEKVNLLARYLVLDKYSFLWRARRRAILEALEMFGVFSALETRDAAYLADR